mmetsp:Transcript_112231/g.358183  ORF Transcript_112231/g.358183 Transcript_112231/m.358183 type:complete len:483 (+) Transcript_112231:475-1923(+)
MACSHHHCPDLLLGQDAEGAQRMQDHERAPGQGQRKVLLAEPQRPPLPVGEVLPHAELQPQVSECQACKMCCHRRHGPRTPEVCRDDRHVQQRREARQRRGVVVDKLGGWHHRALQSLEGGSVQAVDDLQEVRGLQDPAGDVLPPELGKLGGALELHEVHNGQPAPVGKHHDGSSGPEVQCHVKAAPEPPDAQDQGLPALKQLPLQLRQVGPCVLHAEDVPESAWQHQAGLLHGAELVPGRLQLLVDGDEVGELPVVAVVVVGAGHLACGARQHPCGFELPELLPADVHGRLQQLLVVILVLNVIAYLVRCHLLVKHNTESLASGHVIATDPVLLHLEERMLAASDVLPEMLYETAHQDNLLIVKLRDVHVFTVDLPEDIPGDLARSLLQDRAEQALALLHLEVQLVVKNLAELISAETLGLAQVGDQRGCLFQTVVPLLRSAGDAELQAHLRPEGVVVQQAGVAFDKGQDLWPRPHVHAAI